MINSLSTVGDKIKFKDGQVTHWASSQWIQLICDIPEKGKYLFKCSTASAAGEGKIKIINKETSKEYFLPFSNTGSWGQYQGKQVEISFPEKGTYTLYLQPDTKWRPANLKNLESSLDDPLPLSLLSVLFIEQVPLVFYLLNGILLLMLLFVSAMVSGSEVAFFSFGPLEILQLKCPP